jgi:hypothetical protein
MPDSEQLIDKAGVIGYRETMPRPEQPAEPGRQQEERRAAEQAIAPYIVASRYDHEPQAALAYHALQGLIAATDCDLSAYRLMVEDHAFVAVLGKAPSPELDAHIQQLLSSGTFWTLPEDIARILTTRRAQLSKQGSWVEGHHRPGQRMRRDQPKQPS